MENEITLADKIILELDMQSDGWQTTYLFDDVKKAMIQFASIHVKLALESAYNKAELKDKTIHDRSICEITPEYSSNSVVLDKESIINAYPLENIK